MGKSLQAIPCTLIMELICTQGGEQAACMEEKLDSYQKLLILPASSNILKIDGTLILLRSLLLA